MSGVTNNFSLLLTEPFPHGAIAYPPGRLNRSTHFASMFTTTLLPYNKQYDNCKNTLCYTHNKPTNYIYQPHSAYGMVGTTAAAYRGRRHKL